MNKTIFLLTFSAVLTFSILAKAELLPRIVDVPTTNFKYDNDSMTVNITGNLPTQCVVSPRPMLSQTAQKNVLVLTVIGSDYSQNCAMMLGGVYQLAFDIRSLKFDLVELNLDPEATYKIISKDGSFVTTVPFGEDPLTLPYATESVAGGVFAIGDDGQVMVRVSPTRVFEINSPFIDVATFVGQRVEVQGHVVRSRTPAVPVHTAATSHETILVTGISTTAF